ncbi:uncharacterized protein LOC110679095 [Aedes aegypti]|uniref:DUF4729 domain-containing protein n=1 Tax=Aedes aegypti TaxID=7159 RepID=A0A6I8TPG9_AEDAE|nr:uncharacterized protein LOC110679095 [Aedes aegypti]
MEQNVNCNELKPQTSQTSLTLSELDDSEWLSSFTPHAQSTGKDHLSTGVIDSKMECDLPRLSAASDKSIKNDNMEAAKLTSELVTMRTNGKEYVLPFKIRPECGENQPSTYDPVKHLDRYPTEGLDCNDLPHQKQIETVLQKKDLCGDFSIAPSNKKKCHFETPSCKQDATREHESNKICWCSMNSAKELKVDRKPFQCPISSCGDFVSSAFYSCHLKIEHCGLILEGLNPGKVRTILINPELNIHGKNHCNIVYYLTDKLRDFGQSEFQNVVPVLLMSSKFQFIDLEREIQSDQRLNQAAQSSRYHYIFWFTGIVSEKLKIQYSLKINSWQRHQGPIYPLSQRQDLKSVFQSGSAMILSQMWVDKLISRKDRLMEIKLTLS